jgi:hypothetical protein
MTSTADAKRAVKETIEGLGGLDIILANAVCCFFMCEREVEYFCVEKQN